MYYPRPLFYLSSVEADCPHLLSLPTKSRLFALSDFQLTRSGARQAEECFFSWLSAFLEHFAVTSPAQKNCGSTLIVRDLSAFCVPLRTNIQRRSLHPVRSLPPSARVPLQLKTHSPCRVSIAPPPPRTLFFLKRLITVEPGFLFHLQFFLFSFLDLARSLYGFASSPFNVLTLHL